MKVFATHTKKGGTHVAIRPLMTKDQFPRLAPFARFYRRGGGGGRSVNELAFWLAPSWVYNNFGPAERFQ
jgi:hypothetical protein